MFFHENADSSVFINPFGPTLYHDKVGEEDDLIKIKNSIDEQLEYFEGNNKKQLLPDTGSSAISYSTISNGKLFGLDLQMQVSFYNDIVRTKVKEHTKKYYDNYSEVILNSDKHYSLE
ncbi:hypothetical protein EB155_01775 [archaeon]|nr:hypothetical protein [archaeon]